MSQAGLLSIQGLWVGPWLKDVGAMGAIINLWETGVQGSYAPVDYQAAFCIMLIFQILGLLWFFIAPVIFKRQIGQSGDSAHEMRSSGKS